MRIIDFHGVELEKVKGSFQDYFNESFVTYVEDGKEKVFSVLYLRYFEDNYTEFTPFDQNPLWEINGKPCYIKDITALFYLLTKNPRRNQRRIYICDGKEFASIFEGMDKEKGLSILFQ
ncbi:hypothetical protein [Fervidibacillus halotolerans]|uniref:Uncharacterized protein n=1 Tax=Fervidibacillus halotolerans TaxID=2980027 RepID=A0A9E8M240_9BACI|nr:hypothetical protein [Fervidibacillus halotolerans]WAA13806.1 hypothetical protein OE105_06825 [Fervidibacillus halotolerans]